MRSSSRENGLLATRKRSAENTKTAVRSSLPCCISMEDLLVGGSVSVDEGGTSGHVRGRHASVEVAHGGGYNSGVDIGVAHQGMAPQWGWCIRGVSHQRG